MNPAVNDLVRSVVNKNSLSECSVAELQQLVSQYPYFGPAQFLLARKLKEENSPLYTQQSQRAILYFQDHLWFDYLSGDESTAIISPARPAEKETASTADVAEETPVTTEIAPGPVEPVINEEQEQVATDEEIPPAIAEEQHPLPVQEPDQHSTEGNEPGLPGAEQQPELPAFKIEHANMPAQELVFEPYHTVDYFASQGIRFKEEDKPKDRFGQQLRSFTEWLKALKKLPDPVASASQPAAADDTKVTQMAERSITDRDVVTEAMAEVWEKQGNAEKAIEIYRKLSLLNPSKSSYFAAKIEHLKRL